MCSISLKEREAVLPTKRFCRYVGDFSDLSDGIFSLKRPVTNVGTFSGVIGALTGGLLPSVGAGIRPSLTAVNPHSKTNQAWSKVAAHPRLVPEQDVKQTQESTEGSPLAALNTFLVIFTCFYLLSMLFCPTAPFNNNMQISDYITNIYKQYICMSHTCGCSPNLQ